MKILFILSSNYLSGGEKVALDIVENLKEEFEFIFYLPKEPTNEFKEPLKNFKIFYPENYGVKNIIKNIQEVIKNEKPRIVVAHGIRSAFYLKLSFFRFFIFQKKFKFIYILHGIHFTRYKFPKNLFFYFWELITNWLFVDFLICVGRDDFKIAKKLRLNKNIILIENGINYKEYENVQRGKLRKEFGLDEDVIILTTICRLHYQKDIETLIKAMNSLKNEKAALFVIGDGPDKKKLEDLTKKINLEDKIKFLGYRTDVKEILADSDIFILSTRWEGLPIVILEAWASKKPVIASNVRGVRSLIEDKEDGLLFRLKNERDLFLKIKTLVENESFRKELAKNGYEKVSEFYNKERMIKNYKDLFLKCLS